MCVWMNKEFADKELDEYYIPYLDHYYGDECKNLKKLVNKIINEKFPQMPQYKYDDCYSIAGAVLTNLVVKNKFDRERPFEGYLYSAIRNKIESMETAQNTTKRSGKVKDKETGEIDHNSGYKLVSYDAPIDEDSNKTVGDFLSSQSSGFDLHSEAFGNETNSSEKVDEFIDSLSTTDKKIVEMLMDGMQVKEIKQKLGLSNRQYENHMNSIRQNKAVRLFNKNGKTLYKKKQEDKGMKVGIVDNKEIEKLSDEILGQMLSIDTTDSYRTDTLPLGSLLDDKSCGMIDCEYISQRQPFQWTSEQINKYLSRILNNQPIPEIVICELIRCGVKISYLIDGLQRLTYAEEFKEGRIKIGAKGAEFIYVQYRDVVKNEDGTTSIEVKTINIVGKKYTDLPKFLQKRFDNFNVTVTRFFNCTEEMIDYHIRNYNNHTAMTKSQYAITNVGNRTSANIKGLSENHPFFKNVINCAGKGKKNGTLEEVVCKTMMAMYHMDDWKKEVLDMMKYLDEHSTDNEFECLKSNLDELAVAAEPYAKDLKDLFSTTNTHIWLTVYDKAVMCGITTEEFVEFMKDFALKLHNDDVENDEFVTNTYKSRSTKDKKVVVDKVNGLLDRICKYYDVEMEENEEKNSEESCEFKSVVENNKENENVVMENPTIESPVVELEIEDERLEKFLDTFKKSDLMASVKDENQAKFLAFKSLMMYCDKDLEGMDLQTFINKVYVDDEKLDDLNLLQDMLDMWTLDINNSSKLLDAHNMPELLRVVKYINDFAIDDDMVSGWLGEYSSTYIERPANSLEFFNEMIGSLNLYIEKHGKKIA